MTSDPIAQARRLAERFPEALAVLLAGSVAAGRATPSSDLDLAVLVPDGWETYRETVRYEGRLAELFVHTRAGLGELFAADTASRRGVMQSMYADALVLHDPDGLAAEARARAVAELAAGPAPLGAAAVEARRYGLTDLLDDLADAADRREALAVGGAVLAAAAELLCDHHRAWTGTGKWFPRRLLAADAVLGAALLDGHLRLAEHGEPAALGAAAGRVLDLVGGPLSAGYRRSWQGALVPTVG
ncbi:nucleotidyltransferase [Kitasatospora sp. MMS16-BH015]|uniref:nucleotidyltransferase domain-containing protein n=1 Tax=Kitasatospora sp. MMS16-BH015 TaxID=2018025 RepID=UPI000CA32A40|nr:nucleotidyltransferase domain-containing protein [Kitasatospora sp. MMS16-BH015]AUG76973.1 nucleotidyltransferase [Kitasatospora sp. MMS16-BH015]